MVTAAICLIHDSPRKLGAMTDIAPNERTRVRRVLAGRSRSLSPVCNEHTAHPLPARSDLVIAASCLIHDSPRKRIVWKCATRTMQRGPRPRPQRKLLF